MYLCVKGIQVFMNNQPFNSQKGDNDFFPLYVMAKSLLCVNWFIDWNCFSGDRCGPWASCFTVFPQIFFQCYDYFPFLEITLSVYVCDVMYVLT